MPRRSLGRPVSYELTTLGLSLHDTVRQLKLWAEAHMGKALAHRAADEDAAGGTD
ncbi:hypothetical protein [Rhodococcus sp. OK519]|uniref:hypothetical protein n=1 Tax=Rhodococcus sp. OK519 TaxID=2135729 RepID=UPI0015E73309